MDDEVERLRKVLQAKEAVLEDVLCSINQLPRHPFNTILIHNVLKSEVKQSGSTNLDDFKCCISWSALFLENICIAVEVENDTHNSILPSCAAVCNHDLSDTTTIIFDDLLTAQYIPPKNSYSDLAILSFFPSNIRSKQTRIVNVLDLDKPLQNFALSEMDNLSLKEGLKLYQCLYACHFSKLLSITPSHLRNILCNIGKFREVDFGVWQLFIGKADTIWSNFIIYKNALFMEGLSYQCRLFSKNECDMHRMIEILNENNQNH
ncbi:Argininosuccinate lyase [Dirofilaria immitis]